MKRTKKLISFLLITVMIIASIPAISIPVSADRVPTKDYLGGWTEITSWSQLRDPNFIKPGGKYYLANDIDGGGAKVSRVVETTQFYGIFDGRGHTVYNFEFDKAYTGSGAAGFFNQICKTSSEVGDTTICNLNVGKPDAPIKVNLNYNGSGCYLNFGGIVGQDGSEATASTPNAKGIIDNCHVWLEGSANTPSGTASADVRMGGIIGYARDDIITNCSANGYLIDNTGATSTSTMGGIVAVYSNDGNGYEDLLISNCVNNMDLTMNYSTAGRSTDAVYLTSVGGIVGDQRREMVISNCTNNGNLSAKDNGCLVGGIVGCDNNLRSAGVRHHSSHIMRVIVSNCDSNGTYSGGLGCGDIYPSAPTQAQANLAGYKNGLQYIYISNCRRKGNRSTQNTVNNYHNASNVVKIFTKEDLLKVDDVSSNADKVAAAEKIYILMNDIDMRGEIVNGYVVDLYFQGIWDGNGYSVYNFELDPQNTNGGSYIQGNDNNLAFFKAICDTGQLNPTSHQAYVLNFTIGRPDAPIKANSKSSNSVATYLAILATRAGSSTGTENYNYMDGSYNTGNANFKYGNERAYICGVNTYCDINYTGAYKVNVSGLVGNAGKVSITDCNVFGTIKASSGNAWMNVSAFVPDSQKGWLEIINCNNFADIKNDVTTGSISENRAAGFISYTTQNPVIIGCSNYGDVSVKLAGSSITVASGFVGHGKGHDSEQKPVLDIFMLDCYNFGDITGVNADHSNTAPFGARLVTYKTIRIIGCGNLGTNSGTRPIYTYEIAVHVDPASGSTTDLGGSFIEADGVVKMVESAAVLMTGDADEGGIRFRAAVSKSAYDKLRYLSGAKSVTYGMLIAPAEHVSGDVINPDMLTEGEEYYDIVQETFEYNTAKGFIESKWYDKSLHSRSLAASLTKIPEKAFDMELTAMAYVRITMENGHEILITPKNGTVTRSPKAVAEAALADTSHTYTDAQKTQLQKYVA